MKLIDIENAIVAIKEELAKNFFDIELQMQLAELEAMIEDRWSPED